MPAAASAPAAPATPSAPADVAVWATLRRLVSRFGAVRGRTAVVFAAHLLRSLLAVAVPVLLTESIGAAAEAGGVGGRFPALVAAFLACGLLRGVSFYAVSVATAGLAQDVENRLRRDLFEKVMFLRFAWHDQNRAGKTIVRSLRDMEKAKQFYREVAFGWVEIVLLVLAVTVYAGWTHWSFLAASVLVFGSTVVGIARTGPRIARMDRDAMDDYDRVTTAIQENVAGARVVRAFGRQHHEMGRFDVRLSSFSGKWKALSHYWSTALPIVNHATWLVVPAALAAGALYVAESPDAVRVTRTMGVLMAMRLARDFLRQLTRLLLLSQEAVASAGRVFEVLDREDTTAARGPAVALPPGRGDLRLEDVSFAYTPGREVLRGVTLHVPAGGSLGLLGRTGAGKTTLVHLLPRFYDPTAGRILLDGVDLRDVSPPGLASAVGFVFQEPHLFSATVAENVAYGAPGASRERLEACCRTAAVHDFVAGLPKGYDTLVGERGVSLSGGQRQRLTIARALVMDPRVLVLDDATAAVDALTEKDLFRGIRSAATGRTTLVVSQRVTSVRWCDRIAVLEDGRVSAVGTHAELLERSPLYREVNDHQRFVGATP